MKNNVSFFEFLKLVSSVLDTFHVLPIHTVNSILDFVLFGETSNEFDENPIHSPCLFIVLATQKVGKNRSSIHQNKSC